MASYFVYLIITGAISEAMQVFLFLWFVFTKDKVGYLSTFWKHLVVIMESPGMGGGGDSF